jgi:hypothetical protein
LPSARLEAAALAWVQDGMDFADALHLASAAECEAFVTRAAAAGCKPAAAGRGGEACVDPPKNIG